MKPKLDKNGTCITIIITYIHDITSNVTLNFFCCKNKEPDSKKKKFCIDIICTMYEYILHVRYIERKIDNSYDYNSKVVLN